MMSGSNNTSLSKLRTGMALFMTVLALSPMSTVMCHGDDGHRALELAFHDHCHGDHHEEAPPADHPSASLDEPFHSHCLDVPLEINMIVHDDSVDMEQSPVLFYVPQDRNNGTHTSLCATVSFLHGLSPPCHALLDPIILRL